MSGKRFAIVLTRRPLKLGQERVDLPRVVDAGRGVR